MIVLPALMQSIKGSGPMFIRKLVVQMFLMIFNIVLAPAFVSAILSPDCLLHLFFPATPLDSSVSYSSCDEYNSVGDCTSSSLKESSTSFQPSFTYGYQCASSTIISYMPAFIQMYAIVSVIMPLVAVFMFNIMDTNVDDPTWHRTPWGSFWVTLAKVLKSIKTIPPVYKQVALLGNYDSINVYGETTTTQTNSVEKLGEVVSPLHHEATNTINSPTPVSMLSVPTSPTSPRELKRQFSMQEKNAMMADFHDTSVQVSGAPTQTILNPDTIFSHLMGHIMVLITFGFAYPPLAILISITVTIITFQWQVREILI